jgi:riboflavin synthase
VFTGLVEETGIVRERTDMGDGIRFRIGAAIIMDDLGIDDSVSVNGCCLTVVERGDDWFDVTAVAETLRKTTIGTLDAGSVVNLERAVRLQDRLGGHLVQGHVDAVGTILDISINDQGWEIWIGFPAPYRKWIIPVGSICINGISLTVADLHDDRLKIAIIPHTLSVTTMGNAKVGDNVNLEFDMVAKYVENFSRFS